VNCSLLVASGGTGTDQEAPVPGVPVIRFARPAALLGWGGGVRAYVCPDPSQRVVSGHMLGVLVIQGTCFFDNLGPLLFLSIVTRSTLQHCITEHTSPKEREKGKKTETRRARERKKREREKAFLSLCGELFDQHHTGHMTSPRQSLNLQL